MNEKFIEKIISAIDSPSYCMYYISMKDNSFVTILKSKYLKENIEDKGNIKDVFSLYINMNIISNHKKSMEKFTDMSTLKSRIGNNVFITQEYLSIESGWCRGKFIPIREKEEDEFTHVLYIIELIENKNLNKYDTEYENDKNYLTELINKDGFKILLDNIKDEKYIGFVLIDIDFFNTIINNYTDDIANKIIIKVSNIIRKEFEYPDYTIRLGKDRFGVIVRAQENMIGEVVVKKIEKINEQLQNTGSDLPKVTISAGLSYSLKGFTSKLYNETDEVLNFTKSHGRCGCSVYSTIDKTVYDYNNYQLFHYGKDKSLYNKDMYYRDGEEKLIIEDQPYIMQKLKKRSDGGIVCGFVKEGLPIYCISATLLSNLGYTYEEFHEKGQLNFLDYIYPPDRDLILQSKANESNKKKIRLLKKDGKEAWFCENHIITQSTDSREMWISCFYPIRNITIQTLFENEYRVVGMIDCNLEEIVLEKLGVIVTDKSNKKHPYSKLLEYESENTLRPHAKKEYMNNMNLTNVQETLKNVTFHEYIVHHKMKDGSYSAIRHKFRYFDKERGLIIYTEENVGRWAEHDKKVGVLNTYGFGRNTYKILMENKDEKFILLFFNVSGFKAWNNFLGHTGGDIALKEVAKHIENSPISPILTARVEADRFICLVNQSTFNYDLLKEMCTGEIVVNKKVLHMRLKCGVYYINDITINTRDMIERAVLASKYVENYNKEPYYVYNDEIEKEYIEQINVINELPQALEKEQFKVYYQPIFNAKTKEIKGAEALVRWQHPVRGMISPGLFIPALEKKGEISSLDFYVFKSVIKFLKQRKQNNQPLIPISINLSRVDLLNEEMIKNIIIELEKNEDVSQYIGFEVTESAYISLGEQFMISIETIRNKQCPVYIDDFGSGYSSLGCIAKYNFEVIKLDMSLVRSIGNDIKTEAIVAASISLAHKLDGEIIAEGVETKEQYEFLLDNGCDYIQGFYFSRPLPESEFTKLLK